MNESKPKMKLRLNEYLYQKWADTEFSEEEPLSEGEIEEWIHDWYRAKYFQMPPIWLVKRKRKSRWPPK
jgi:hypothetical protein